MSAVWCVKGQDPWAAYRLVGQEPDRYRYSCREIRGIESKYQVSNVLLNASVNAKQTITGGSHLFNVPNKAICAKAHS